MKILSKKVVFVRIFALMFTFFISQEVESRQPPRYIEKRTRIREVLIDNYITWYNTVISNHTSIVNLGNQTGEFAEIWWDLNVYLIPDYIKDGKFIINSKYWKQWVQNLDFYIEKYKIGIIPYNNYCDDEEHHIPCYWYGAKWLRNTPTTKYSYKIEKIWSSFTLMLYDEEKDWVHSKYVRFKYIIYKYRYYELVLLLIILLYIEIKVLEKIKNRKKS